MNITELKHRDDFPNWLNANGLIGQGAEIGAGFGSYAKFMLENWRGEKYYAIDMWAKQEANIYKETQTCGIEWTVLDYEEWLKSCTELASKDSRMVIVRASSIAAAAQIADGSLDFAYIDANHDLAPVLSDLIAWYPKVKPGGIFCGHDYYDKYDEGHCGFVKSAMMLWNHIYNLPIHTTCDTSWWIMKA